MRNVVLHIGNGPFVGLHLLESLCARAGVERVFLLTSGPDGVGHPGRLPYPVDSELPAGAKLRVLPAGMPPYQSGAPGEIWGELSGSVDTVLYCMERQHSGIGSESARALYVEPLKNWVAFLEDNEGVRLGLLSTAFVAGRRRGLFTEFDLDCGQEFRDPWERCMFEAERLLRSSVVGERVTVFRPSHVIGDSRSGHAYAFNGLYNLLHLLRQVGRRVVAGDARSRLDVVPVDYVADAVVALSESADAAGKNFHLVAGWHRSTSLTDLVGMVTSHERGGARRVFIVPPVLGGLLRGLDAVRADKGGARPNGSSDRQYDLTQTAVFDDYLARAALESKEISCAPLDAYLGKVIWFAEEHGWQPAGATSDRLSV